MAHQLSLLDIKKAYCSTDLPLTNRELYSKVAKANGISNDDLKGKSAVGKSGQLRSLVKRKIRWFQQTLKAMGVIEKVDGKRGVWSLTAENKKGLHEPQAGVRLVAYSTKLGVALWGNSKSVFSDLSEPIHLCITSPPYPLRNQRNYGNVCETEWVDFLTESLEPVVDQLVDGGSIVLNVSNDIFESKRPSRSLYLERMVLALHDRLGLSLMDRIPWVNFSKPPGPTQWACVNRVQLCTSYEPIYWFTNNPNTVRSDNRRVLQEHTEKHKKYLEQGGEHRNVKFGDGAYQLRSGKSFSNKTKGKIPKNVFQKGHSCKDTRAIRAASKSLGLPSHSAMFPTSLPEFYIKFLTKKDDLVVDPFAGSNKVGLAAERNDRRWLSCDKILEYVRSQAELFRDMSGFYMNPLVRCVGGKCENVLGGGQEI